MTTKTFVGMSSKAHDHHMAQIKIRQSGINPAGGEGHCSSEQGRLVPRGDVDWRSHPPRGTWKPRGII